MLGGVADVRDVALALLGVEDADLLDLPAQADLDGDVLLVGRRGTGRWRAARGRGRSGCRRPSPARRGSGPSGARGRLPFAWPLPLLCRCGCSSRRRVSYRARWPLQHPPRGHRRRRAQRPSLRSVSPVSVEFGARKKPAMRSDGAIPSAGHDRLKLIGRSADNGPLASA